VKHCIACANGTDALQISQMSLGIGSGDEVITPGFSYIAAAETIALLGATPVYADIDPKTYNLDVNTLEGLITSKTKAIIPVSMFGQCADMDEICRIAQQYGLSVVEDGAQSFGATYKNRQSGSLSTIACTSFFPSKPLGCYGDGGAIFTDDDNLASVMRQIAAHGEGRRYHHVRIGLNSRLDTLQAAILLCKLDIFDEEIVARQRIADCYNKGLNKERIVIPHIEEFNTSVHAQYSIQIENRDELQKKLTALGIPTAIHYPSALYAQPALYRPDMSLIAAEEVVQNIISLPMHPYITDDEIAKIVESIL